MFSAQSNARIYHSPFAASTTQQRQVVQIVRVEYVGSDGTSTETKLKAVALGSAGVWWQAREIFRELCKHRGDLDVNGIINTQIGKIHTWYTSLGWEFDGAISRSRWSAAALDLDFQDHTRQGWYLRSTGFLLLLLCWAFGRRRLDEQSVGKRFLCGFFCKVSAASIMSDHDWMHIMQAYSDECEHPPVREGCCGHLVGLCKNLGIEPDMAKQRVLASWTEITAPVTGRCEAIAKGFGLCLDTIAEEVDGRVEEGFGEEDLLRECMHIRGAKRRLNIDEDFSAAVTAAVQSGRARTRRTVLRIDGQVDVTTSSR